ncbi:hypothetical protein ACX12E_30725 [Paenibacillus vandeheii]
MLNEKIIVRVKEHVPGYEGKTVGVARKGDIFIFRNPIGHLSDAEYLTCYKLGRSDFVEPFKRSTERQWIEQEEKYQIYFNELSERFMPIIEAYWQEDGADVELYWGPTNKTRKTYAKRNSEVKRPMIPTLRNHRPLILLKKRV